MRAQVNLPLGPGDALYAGQAANLELQVGARAFVRAGGNTQIGLENQEPDFLQFRVTSGHLAVDVRDMEAGNTIEIDTPNGVLAVERNGYYRVDVTDDASTFSARRGGRALITPENGEVRSLEQSEQVVIQGVDTPTYASYAAADLDAWDRWNYERTDRIVQSKSARYVPAGVYGTSDLDEYGTWEETREYGPVWRPRHVAADWVPYSDGRWVWDVSFGWTWVDYQPWGWAPCHYGRWVHYHSGWAWAPGPVVVTPVYTPAVVAFFGTPHVSVSIGIPGPSVGWVGLSWGEPIVPWWGHAGYVGVPTWRGWGGPRVVNRTVINNTNIVNVNQINVYENAHHNAVVAMREDRFGRAFDRPQRVRREAIEQLQPVRGQLGVRPVSASLVPRREKGVRPPEKVLRRPVVATRPPRDAETSLRAQGIDVRNRPVSAPRIVRGARPGRDAVQRSAGGQPAPQTAPRAEQGVEQQQRPDLRQQPQQDVRQPGQPERRGGRMQNLPRKETEANQPPAVGSAPRAPVPSAAQDLRSRESTRNNPPLRLGRAARQQREMQRPETAPRDQRAPRPPTDQVQQQRERGRPQAAPHAEQRAPQPPAEPARPRREMQRPQSPRAERRAPAPEEYRPQQRPEGRQQRMTRAQPQAPAPVTRSRPEPNRRQAPAVSSRPERAPRQSEVRSARPQHEPASRPQRVERKQQAPAAAAPSQRQRSAGDAPQHGPTKKKAPRSAPHN